MFILVIRVFVSWLVRVLLVRSTSLRTMSDLSLRVVECSTHYTLDFQNGPKYSKSFQNLEIYTLDLIEIGHIHRDALIMH